MKSMRCACAMLAMVLVAATASAATPAGVAAGKTLPRMFAQSPAASPLMLWTAPVGLAAPGEWVDLEVEVVADGVLLFEESVAVRGAEAGAGSPGLVSLLHRHPEERATLRELAASGGVEVRVLSGGAVIDRFAPGGMAAPSAEAAPLELRFAPQPVAAKDDGGDSLFLESVTGSLEQCEIDRIACMQDCRAGYEACIRSGTCFPQLTCSLCDGAYAGCKNACPTCPCQPTSHTEERENLYFQGWGSPQCLNGPFGTHYYRDDSYLYCEETVQVTENCDGTTTEELVWSSCQNVTCWSNTGQACSMAWGSAPYGCY